MSLSPFSLIVDRFPVILSPAQDVFALLFTLSTLAMTYGSTQSSRLLQRKGTPQFPQYLVRATQRSQLWQTLYFRKNLSEISRLEE
jgi:hypothetical protein